MGDPFELLVAPRLHFGNAVERVRWALRLSQAAFGAMLEGYTQTNIARYETGETEPPLDFWRKFGRSFGLNLTWVIIGSGDPYEGGEFGLGEIEKVRFHVCAMYSGGGNTNRANPLQSESLRAYLGLENWYGREVAPYLMRMPDVPNDDELFGDTLLGGVKSLRGKHAAKEVRNAAAKKKPKTRRRQKGA